MKQISLTSIQLAHFRSFIEPTMIDLTTVPGLKLITGDNLVEPRLGANGCGKSTIWDAACFAFYGTSVKGLRAADLITHSEQTTEVMVFFTVDGEEHSVHRAAPPMRLYIDDKAAEQADVEALIGLSKARFLNSVIFGQAVPLFLDLPVPARGDLLDEVLDLELWMLAANKATAQHSIVEQELVFLRQDIAKTTGGLEGLGDLERFREQIDVWDQQKQQRLNDIINEFEGLERDYDALDQERAKLPKALDEADAKQRYEHFRTQNGKARERLTAIDTRSGTILRDIEFLANNDACPTCDQSITEAHRTGHIDRVMPQLEKLDKDREIAALDTQTTQAEEEAWELTVRTIIRTNQEKKSAIALLDQQMRDKRRLMDRLEEEAERVSRETNPYTAEADRTVQEYKRLDALLEQQRADESAIVSRLASRDYWRQGFRKVRLYCLDRVLQELTVETRNSLLALGLVGWSVEFKTATETKSGTMKLGVQVQIQSPQASHKSEAMSGGEGQRGRLAISLGLANLIQRWAGVQFDLEVFDEPTAWLSEQGVEDLLESLRLRAETNNRSIWVCDHRALTHSGFSEIMSIIKTTEGSRVEEFSPSTKAA